MKTKRLTGKQLRALVESVLNEWPEQPEFPDAQKRVKASFAIMLKWAKKVEAAARPMFKWAEYTEADDWASDTIAPLFKPYGYWPGYLMWWSYRPMSTTRLSWYELDNSRIMRDPSRKEALGFERSVSSFVKSAAKIVDMIAASAKVRDRELRTQYGKP